MKLPAAPLNRDLVGMVESRILAESAYINGRLVFLRMVGWGCVALGFGGAIGLVLYGYATIASNVTTSEKLAAEISKAMSQAEFRVTASGVVDIEPRQLQLASNQTVAIDPTSRIQIDPASRIPADGELKVQLPALPASQPSIQRASSRIPTITNFTIFKSVPYLKGDVMTGWIFLTSAQKEPTRQYCYYTEGGEASDVSLRINIATDEKMENLKASAAFDQAAAFSKCVWFARGP
jgi:hypothetical protein